VNNDDNNKMCRETVMTKFEVLSRHWSRGTEEN